jgi:hypothetical protein
VKSGEVDPSALAEAAALELMLADPLLIRRPLMEVGEEQRVGFSPEAVDAWIGLKSPALIGDVESCPKSPLAQPCAVPAASP